MAERLCAGLLHRESEFAVVNGTRLFGACGPCALASAVSNVRGTVVHTGSVYTVMRGASLCDPSGASTIDALRIAAGKMGIGVAAYRGYGEPWSDFSTFFRAHAGYQPFVIEVANGQAFKDSISGAGENATNLQYHFIAILGRHDGGYSPRANRTLPAGYWCADGDNFAGGNSNANGFNAADVLQFYPDNVMAAARPCGALVLAKPGAKIVITIDKNDKGEITGAHDGDLKVGAGFAQLIAQGQWTEASITVGETYTPDGGYSTAILRGATVQTLIYSKHDNALKAYGGNPLANAMTAYVSAMESAESHATSVQADLNTAQGDLASAQTQIADLKAQIAKLQSQPAPPAAQPTVEQALQIVYKAAQGA